MLSQTESNRVKKYIRASNKQSPKDHAATSGLVQGRDYHSGQSCMWTAAARVDQGPHKNSAGLSNLTTPTPGTVGTWYWELLVLKGIVGTGYWGYFAPSTTQL